MSSSEAVTPISPDRTITSTSPGHGYKVLGEVRMSSVAEVTKAVDTARIAQRKWFEMGLDARLKKMEILYKILEDNQETLAKASSEEMGMPITMARAHASRACQQLRWSLDNAKKYLSDEITYEDDKMKVVMSHEPYGVVACIVAWNFPIPNFEQSVCPALIAGNTVVMKYSEEIPLFQQTFERLIEESDFPEGVVNFVYGDGEIGKALSNADYDFLTFTGSSKVGKGLYQTVAGKFKPLALELGGSSPGLVFEDADLNDDIIAQIFNLRFSNTGQFCSNLKRLFVHESRVEELTEKLVTFAKTQKVGDPLDENTQFGPLVAKRQVDALEVQLKDALDKGAKVLCGGKKPDGLEGAYFEPTILANISDDMKVVTEEVFGPILPIMTFSTYEDAIFKANDTNYGLTAYVYTSSKDIAEQAGRDIKAGTISANLSNGMQPCTPFGGFKESGIGRQRGSEGFHEVTQVKVISYDK